MNSRVDTGHSALDQSILDRRASLFAGDLATVDDALSDSLRGARILMIGAAGSIGSSTLDTILQFGPASVDIVDHNENGLADLTRNLRSQDRDVELPALSLMPFDYGGEPFRLWLRSQPAYDHVLNFAALKHVRSEKDPFSILAMLETNVLHLDRLGSLLSTSDVRRVFSVSTDKAANPSSMMGATKRLMEHALFLPSQAWNDATSVTSARFANVAFSNGSLLRAWHDRIALDQPLACPDQCRRYFVSLLESGHLCTLAAMVGSSRTIAVPSLEPQEHLVLLADVATRFLAHHGYEAHFTHDEHEAKGRMRELVAEGRWPVLLTPLDTSGEKPYEEFVAASESVRGGPLPSLLEVGYVPPDDRDSFGRLVTIVRHLLGSDDSISIDELRALIAAVEPTFATSHRASALTLDNRM